MALYFQHCSSNQGNWNYIQALQGNYRFYVHFRPVFNNPKHDGFLRLLIENRRFIIVEKDWVWRRRVNMAASAAETRKSKMKSASYGDTVIETFKELKQNDELCDFTVSAEGKSIKVP